MLLINPQNGEYGGNLSRFTPLSLPMPIGCLAAAMIQAGYPARIWDEELGQIDDALLAELTDGLPTPLVFGISVLTGQASRAYELCDWLKKKHTDCVVIMGGFHVTAVPDEPFAACDVDFVVRGEGERTLIELYALLRQQLQRFHLMFMWPPYEEIKGLTFRKGVDGPLFSTFERPLIADLSTLPEFPYDMFAKMLERVNSDSPRKKNYDWGFIVTSRGCPYKCSYCAQRMMTGNTYRWRPIDVVLNELDTLVNRFHATSVFFLDDNFCFKRQHTIDLCNRIRDSQLGYRCNFSLQTRADNFYEELVPVMQEAGFTSVGFGMEVGTDSLMEQIHKGETIQQHVDAVAMAKKYGMDVAMFMIYGIPTETHADRKTAYKLCKSMGLTHLKFNNLMPYPGTPMNRDLMKTNRFKKVGHWTNFTSTLSEMGSSLTKRKPLPYVPETSSEIELMRDVIRYNLLATLFRWTAVKGILTRRHGPGWFKLQAGWYVKPTEIFYIASLAFLLLRDLAVASCPLWILEPIMQWRNPNLQRRLSKDLWPEHKSSGWEFSSWKKEMN